MAIETTHKRAITGNDLGIKVTAPQGKRIVAVKCLLDGLGLQEPTIMVPVDHHAHTHLQAGGASPFRDHTLVVTATYDDVSTEPAQDNWQDSV